MFPQECACACATFDLGQNSSYFLTNHSSNDIRVFQASYAKRNARQIFRLHRAVFRVRSSHWHSLPRQPDSKHFRLLPGDHAPYPSQCLWDPCHAHQVTMRPDHPSWRGKRPRGCLRLTTRHAIGVVNCQFHNACTTHQGCFSVLDANFLQALKCPSPCNILLVSPEWGFITLRALRTLVRDTSSVNSRT